MCKRKHTALALLSVLLLTVSVEVGCGSPKVKTHPPLDERIRNLQNVPTRQGAAPQETAARELSAPALESERMLGHLYSALMLQGSVLLVAPELGEEVQQVACRLATIAGCQETIRTFVVNLPLANAWTEPSGDIIITSGLLTLIENPDELAVALGHEIAHLRHHHGRAKVLDALSSRKTTERFAQILVGTASGAGSAALGVVPGSVPISEPFSRALFNEVVGRLLSDLGARLITHAGFLAAQAALAAHLSQYSQAQELCADRESVRYAALAGYDPQKGVRIFHKLRQLEGQAARKDAGAME